MYREPQPFQHGQGLIADQRSQENLRQRLLTENAESQRQNALKNNIGSSFSSLSPQTEKTNLEHNTIFEQDRRPQGIIDAFVKICQRWNLDEDQQIILLGLHVNESTGRLILKGLIRSRSPDVNDRAGYVVGIGLGLFALFGESKQAEIEWLHNSQKILQNKSPLHFMLEGRMQHLIIVAKMLRLERGA